MTDPLVHVCQNLSVHHQIADMNVSVMANAQTNWLVSIKNVVIHVSAHVESMPFVMLLVIRPCAYVHPVILAILLRSVLRNNVR